MRPRWFWASGGGAAVLAGLALWVRMGPVPDELFETGRQSTTIVDRSGAPLYEARAADGTRGLSLVPDTLPDALVQATLAAEDHRFFHHVGIDPIALMRAAVHDLMARRPVEGGSTITQQVAKLLLIRQAGHDGRNGEHRSWTM